MRIESATTYTKGMKSIAKEDNWVLYCLDAKK